MVLKLRNRKLDEPALPLVMGILNVTPDSFSDGGDFFLPADAVTAGAEMIADGADIIDVGPESTRPGAKEVPPDEQIRRVIPVIQALRAADDEVPISIDTRSATVAKAALEAGADVINDVSALRDDPGMTDVAAQSGATVVIMHRKGTSATMQQGGGPEYDDVVGEISEFLRERIDWAKRGGITSDRIIIDPGLGFGKRARHNLLILRHLDHFASLGQPLLIGASRKSFIAQVLCELNGGVNDLAESGNRLAATGTRKVVTGPACERQGAGPAAAGVPSPKERLAGSLACAALAALAGASIIRAHDVKATVRVVKLCTAIRNAR